MYQKSAACAAILLLAPSASPAAAAVQLPRVNINAEQPVLVGEGPTPKTQVNAKDLQSINATHAYDALKYQPSLNIDKRYIGDHNPEISFRGNNTTPRTIVMGDGILLSNFLSSGWNYGPRWNLIQPEEIESVEVIYGPYAAEYSGNAMGGAIILHTGMPEEFQANVSVGGFVQSFEAYGTDDNYEGHTLNASVGGKQGRWSYFLAADRLVNESQPMQFGVTYGSGNPPVGNPVSGAHPHAKGGYVYNAMPSHEVTSSLLKLKLGYDITESLQARLTLGHVRRERESLSPETYLRDAAGRSVHDGMVDIDGKSYRVSAADLSLAEDENLIYGLELAGELGENWQIEAAASVYDVLENTSRDSDSNYATAKTGGGPGTLSNNQGSGWQTLDLKLSHSHNSKWFGRRVKFGLHADRYLLDHANYVTSNWQAGSITSLSGDSEGTTSTYALFLANEWQLAAPLTLELGLRQEWWRAYDGSLAKDVSGHRVETRYPERSESHLSPKGVLTYVPSADWMTSLSLAEAYRFPTVGELYQGTLDNMGNLSSGFDPNLKPEHVFAKNLMLRRFFDKAIVTLNLWEQDVDNSIFRHRDWSTGVWIYENVGRIRTRGIELMAETRSLWLAGLDLGFNVTYLQPKVLESDDPSQEGNIEPGIAEWRVKLTASYQLTRRMELGAGLRYKSDPYESLDNAAGEKANDFGFDTDFLVLDARLNFAVNEHVSLAAGVNNITDDRYYAYHPHPGRTFFGKVAWQF